MDKIKLNSSSSGVLVLPSDNINLDGFSIQIDSGFYYLTIDKVGDITTIILSKLNRYGQTNIE